MNTASPITALKGIGEKTAALFHRVGVDTVGELLSYYPRTYDVYERPVSIGALEADKIQAVTGVIRRIPDGRRVGRYHITTVSLEENGLHLQLSWFNMPFLRNSLLPGCIYIFRGRVQKKKGRTTMDQPEIYAPEDYEKLLDTMQPIYGLTGGLSNKTVTKAVRQAFEQLDLDTEYLPERIRNEQQLAEYNFSLRTIHFPVKREDLLLARKRLVFDEFFLFILALRQMKEQTEDTVNECVIHPGASVEQLLSSLPYELTGAQKRVWNEIQADLKGETIMNRLVQGDVGSGKTVIALLALLSAVESGYQGALMAPTEVLARQHAESIRELLSGLSMDVCVELLTGSMTGKQKREAREAIASGQADLAVGTHALISDSTEFQNLGLVITDEQHRFGVGQRSKLSAKGEAPHLLVMSATPIPRTLALLMYGDLEVSVLDELPPGRQTVETFLVGESYRARINAFIRKQVAEGHQCFVVCPAVEENQELNVKAAAAWAETLQKTVFPDLRVALLHGQMKGAEKEQIMAGFAQGQADVLVATTVIEVGVDVPNATLMVIEDADRFGLSQLHQLRGRVGRGSAKSYCILTSHNHNPETLQRLKALCKTNDGFKIAEEDLKIRGPGDFFGSRQSGLPAFRVADLSMDMRVLTDAQQASKDWIETYGQSDTPEAQALRERVKVLFDRSEGTMN